MDLHTYYFVITLFFRYKVEKILDGIRGEREVLSDASEYRRKFVRICLSLKGCCTAL